MEAFAPLEQSQDAADSQGPQDGRSAAKLHIDLDELQEEDAEREYDDEEIEYIPVVVEVGRFQSDDLDDSLKREDRHKDVI